MAMKVKTLYLNKKEIIFIYKTGNFRTMVENAKPAIQHLMDEEHSDYGIKNSS
jgi:hypothetical protein